ncbi:MAG: hypothetical protein Q4D16_03470 [Eubacteriales bacterium]|nr:hypothetical protein [Eubacteriales bacterium]
MYADYNYYTSGYLLGRNPVIPEEVFPFWEKQAGKEIDKHTYGRLSRHTELISDDVKDCTCELAELLYQADSAAQQALQQGGAGLLTSYSNDGDSGTFDLSQSSFTEEGKAKKTREIIYKYLANTGLLYAGVR